jgi:hypothetical protein
LFKGTPGLSPTDNAQVAGKVRELMDGGEVG